MNKLVFAALAASLLGMTACAKPASSDIGLVDVPRLTANWPKFLNYQNQLNADMNAIRVSHVSDSQKQREMVGLQVRFATNQTELTNNVHDAAAQVASNRHLRYVFTRQFVGYGGVDITPDVEKILQIVEKGTTLSVTADLGTLGAIAERTGGRVIGDAGVRVARIAAIDDVDPTTLTFATDERFLRAALASRAAAILAGETLIDPAGTYAKPIVAVASPRLALATLLAALEPPRPRGPHRDPSAVVDPSATLAPDVYVGPLVSVGAQASIGAQTVLAAGVVIGAGARIGAACMLHPRAYVADRCVLGDRVVLQAQAVVGSDGFGWAFLDGTLQKIPQIGIVELGDDVEIGANTCVDRAQTGVTSIGNGTKIDNLCQIGHNCRIGQHTAIAAQTGLAGSTTIGDYVQIGGQSGFRGHLTIGSGAKIGGGAEVWGDVDAGATVSGSPARAHRENLRVQASLRRLPKLYERVDALERARTLDKPGEH